MACKHSPLSTTLVVERLRNVAAFAANTLVLEEEGPQSRTTQPLLEPPPYVWMMIVPVCVGQVMSDIVNDVFTG